MDVRNRMANVVKLRCNACQAFLKLIIKDGWRQFIYDKAQKEVTANGRYKDKYIATYEKMRDIGIENYQVEDMDVSFISEVIHGCRSIAPTEERTRKAIELLVEDRNIADHSNENEDEEELYLRCLLALCDLQKFVRIVDKEEKGIQDADRLLFRRTYITKIEELKHTLDEERILLVQRVKNMEEDIGKILESENRTKAWYDLSKVYEKRYYILEKTPEIYYEFVLRASDAGVEEAHMPAADYCFFIEKDAVEGEKRLCRFLESSEELSIYKVKCIIHTLNSSLLKGIELTERTEVLVDKIVCQGYTVSKGEDGLFLLKA